VDWIQVGRVVLYDHIEDVDGEDLMGELSDLVVY
jgi:hypothetical protein